MRRLRPLVIWLLVALPSPAAAQAVRGGYVHRFELAGELGYFSGVEIGSANAALRANAPTGGAFTLFKTATSLSASFVADARVGWWASRRIAIEGHLGYSRPAIETSVSADAEGAAPITVVERVNQYVIDAGILLRINEVRIGGLVPYAAGGAGYLRQLHEGLAFIDQGHAYHVGGGVTRDFVTRTRGVIRAAGLRADARVYFLSGAASLNDRTTAHGSYSAGLFIRF